MTYHLVGHVGRVWASVGGVGAGGVASSTGSCVTSSAGGCVSSGGVSGVRAASVVLAGDGVLDFVDNVRHGDDAERFV